MHTGYFNGSVSDNLPLCVKCQVIRSLSCDAIGNGMTLPLLIGNVKRCDGFERAHIQIFVWIDACRWRATTQIKMHSAIEMISNDSTWFVLFFFVQKTQKIIEFFSCAVPSRRYTVSFLSVLLIWWCRSIISDCSSGINGCINHSFIFNSTSFAQFSTTFFGFVFRFLREKKINPKSCHFLTKMGKKTDVLMRNTMKQNCCR